MYKMRLLNHNKRENKLLITVVSPAHFKDYDMDSYIALSVGDVHVVGKSWKEAIKEELLALAQNHTWDIVPYSTDMEVID